MKRIALALAVLIALLMSTIPLSVQALEVQLKEVANGLTAPLLLQQKSSQLEQFLVS